MRLHHVLSLTALAVVTASSCTCGSRPATEVLTPELEACTEDEKCETGLCDEPGDAGKLCLRKCTSGCRNTDICEPLEPGRYGCVPERAGLCKTCSSDDDCPWPGDHCITLGGEAFCGRDCSFDQTCPSSFRCAEATLLDGGTVAAQCQPTSGTCDCIAATSGQQVPCEVSNGFGQCIGTQTCLPPDGYTQCTARTPSAEVCNGIDDDCNGQTDEGLTDLTCGVGECRRSAASCANGVPQQCTPGMPGAETCNGKDDDCDGTVDNGFDTMTDVLNCGSCNTACSFPHSVPGCVMGTCGIDHCQPGWSDADHVVSNGCEYPCTPSDTGIEECNGVDDDCDGLVDEDFNLVSDPDNCGQCNLVCSVPGTSVATYQCVARSCAIGTCAPGRGNCNQQYADGCEVNTDTDVLHCGGCAMPCATPNATPQCAGGACGILSCNPGFANCNGQVPDGCEVNTSNDVQHCGSCSTVCSFANATPACTTGACTFTCQPNWWDADSQSANGCEYACVRTNGGVEACDNIDNDCDNQVDENFDLTSDVSHCGSCNHACNAPFATSVCSASSCGILSCNAGRANCNGLYVDGCEVDTQTSLTHCGACNNTCTTPNATPACTSGACAIASCNTGFRDCDSQVPNGCEVNVTNDVANCGGCGAQCAPAHAAPVCLNGTCNIASCLPGFWNLNGLIADGCEYACVYTNGGIETCDGVDNDCDGLVDEDFNLATDVNHCGSCTTVCAAANVSVPNCVAGSCGVQQCANGFANCNGQFSDGCEVNTNTSLSSCGACGNVCSTANASPACVGGTCQVQACNAGYTNCNGLASDGCEVHTSADPNNCGGCGNVCSRPNTVPSCVSNSCQFTCLPNFWDLDGNPANGCEYACTFVSSTDTPDLGLVDANCDGLDGEWNNSIFVAPTGNDANPGTPTAPKKTISAGVAAAVTGGQRDVLVAGGTYNEQVTINAANKGVYGGYTAPAWSRSLATGVTVTGVNTPLVITSAANAVVQAVNFVGSNASGSGATAYGALIVNSPGVRLEKVVLTAGNGAAGAGGTAGSTGGSGGNGQPGQQGCEDSGGLFCNSCNRPLGGAGGLSACGRTGGTGGQPGNGSGSGDTGGTGVVGTPGGPGTPSGHGNWTTPATYWGQDGAPGTNGANGSNGASFGVLTIGGYVVAGTTGGTAGTHGNAGGGGGGGGGGTTNCNSYGGGGGGGGAGGCAGGGGTAGQSGGGSFAVYLWGSSVQAVSCTLTSGNGGNGGNGGARGVRGTGGAGGPQNPYGGSGEQDDGSNGGRGGAGGEGGYGGYGGSGGGGPTVGVVRANGSTWSATATTIATGTAGVGGTAAGSGATGLKQDTY